MKWYADQRRSERELQVRDWVYLKLQPYRQTSIALRKHLKLCPKFYGPNKVLQRVGKVAYKLELPTNSLIHPVFHVSLLKKRIGQNVTPPYNNFHWLEIMGRSWLGPLLSYKEEW